MRSENKLKESYQKQLELFNSSKEKKLDNLSKRKNEISQKISKLQTQLAEIEKQEEIESRRSFRTYEDFLQQSRRQSNEKRDQTT
jgi:cell division protein FtsB